MRYKIWLEQERQMTTFGITLSSSGVLVVTDENLIAKWFSQKRADRIYGYFLQELPMLAAPWSASELHALDNTTLYVGDIVTDNGGNLYIVVPDQYGSIKFLYSDVPNGTFVIGCPWDNVGDDVTVHGNVFENADLVTNAVLLEAAFKQLQMCKLEIK